MMLLLRLVINGDNEHFFFPNLSDLVLHLQTGYWQGKEEREIINIC